MGSPSHQLLASSLLPRFPPKGLSFESSWWLYKADGNRFQTCRRGTQSHGTRDGGLDNLCSGFNLFSGSQLLGAGRGLGPVLRMQLSAW